MGLTEPLRGWRSWRAIMNEESVYLRGITQNTVWPPRKALEARCAACQKEDLTVAVPQESHECGMYGFYSQRAFVPYMISRSPIVVGWASYWGRIIQHEDGFRAQYAYPLELFVLPIYIAHGASPRIVGLSERTTTHFVRSLRDKYLVDVSVADDDLVRLCTNWS